MNVFKIEVVMNGAISHLWFQTQEEAERIYDALKKAMDSSDNFPIRNKDDDKIVEVVASYGNKYSYRVAAMQSVVLMPGDNQDWFEEFNVEQIKRQDRLEKLASLESA